MNYAVDRIETMAHEDVYFGKYQGAFNPLVTAVLLFCAAHKSGNNEFTGRAFYFLETFERKYRRYLSNDFAVKWTSLYRKIWKSSGLDVYKELSDEWLEKVTDDLSNLE